MPTINRFYCKVFPLLYIPLFLICSCKSKDEKVALKALEESLTYSNRIINFSSEEALHTLENKLYDQATHYRAEIWFPRAKYIKEVSESVYNYIEDLKKEKKLSGDNADSLLKRLIKYKQELFATDSSIKNIFSKDIILSTSPFDSSDPKKFNYTFFKNASSIETSSMLSSFQNSVKIIENKMVIFCNENVSSFVDGFKTFSGIVGQNSKTFAPGENIEITAGVGSFDIICKPEISINGKKVKLNENGVAEYKTSVASKPGNYSSPVEISYINFDGIRETRKFIVEYTVLKPCDQ